jgi:Flp pilus assembly protein TadD
MKLPGDRHASFANLAVRCATFAAFALSALRRPAPTAFAALLGLGALTAMPTPVHAQNAPVYRDDTTVADNAIAAHNWTQALSALDHRIATNPRDVQARFKRATILARLGRDDEAIAAFQQITQTSPELPEPYNNLAALYAKHGRYQDARATLEAALAANGTFTLARRNLADIYLRLAEETYQTVVKETPSDTVAAARLQGIEQMVTASAEKNVRHAPPKPPTVKLKTTAERANARGFVPSMGSQPPLIVPDTSPADTSDTTGTPSSTSN